MLFIAFLGTVCMSMSITKKKKKKHKEYLINTIEYSTWENGLTLSRTFGDVVSTYVQMKGLPVVVKPTDTPVVSDVIYIRNNDPTFLDDLNVDVEGVECDLASLEPAHSVTQENEVDTDVAAGIMQDSTTDVDTAIMQDSKADVGTAIMQDSKAGDGTGIVESSTADDGTVISMQPSANKFRPSTSAPCLKQLKILMTRRDTAPRGEIETSSESISLSDRTSKQQDTHIMLSCTKCEFTCALEESLQVHILTHDNNPTCEVCGKGFDFLRDLKRHRSTHSTVKGLECPYCEFKCHQKGTLTDHIRTHTNEKPYTCKVCSKSFARSSDVKRHELTHSDVKRFKCPECAYECHRRCVLQQHLYTHSKEKPFICEVCNKAFSHVRFLKNHEAIHSAAAVQCFECPHCEFKSHVKGRLTQHLIKHTEEKPFICETCSKTFARRSALKSHQLTHTELKQFECPQCDYKSGIEYSLQQHFLHTHSEEKPKFECPYCEYKCHQKGTLTNHIRTHTNEKPYICETCSKSFARRGDLKRHELIHTGVKRFECPQCDYKCQEKSKLTRHLRSHAKQNPSTWEVIVS